MQVSPMGLFEFVDQIQKSIVKLQSRLEKQAFQDVSNPDEIRGKVVIGNLPLNLAALCKELQSRLEKQAFQVDIGCEKIFRR